MKATQQQSDARRRFGWMGVFRTTEGAVGLVLALVVISIVLFGELLAPYDPNRIAAGPTAIGPSSAHLMGTDALGRDVLSRFLVGGQQILLVAAAAVVLAFFLGVPLGLIAAYKSGVIDEIIVRLFDIILTLPPLLVILVVITGFGTSFVVMVVTIGLVFVPRVGRIVRSAAQGIVTLDYVAAAKTRGEKTSYILLREILPNNTAPLVAEMSLRFTYAIIFVTSLNFLGLGVQPPTADWGVMLNESRLLLGTNSIAAVAPATAIAIASVSFALISDAVARYFVRDEFAGTLIV